MQPKQQRALELILAGHSVTDIAAQVGVRRETVWRWRNDPSFASEVSVRQAQRRQAIHDELDAGVIESVRMLRGLVADTDAPPGARVRAATALMDRAGLTPAYAVEVRHSADHAQQQAAQPQIEDAERMAREILQSLPTVMAVLPADEVRSHLSQLGPFLV
jgi:transposase-like protein